MTVADGPVLVLDDNDSPTVVVVQNDLLRYLFADDDEDGDGAPVETQR